MKSKDGRLELAPRSAPRTKRPPSKVAVVSATLIQALLRADRARRGECRACVVAQAINVRGRTVPLVSAQSCGIWATFSTLELDASQAREMEGDFPGLVFGMRGAAAAGVEECRRLLSDREFGRWALVGSYVETDERGEAGECKVVWVSDWSKFGDYEVDLGMGKAEWVSMAGGRLEDILVLMGTKDKEGIEAWVSLHESDMRIVEADHEIRKLTSTKGLSKMNDEASLYNPHGRGVVGGSGGGGRAQLWHGVESHLDRQAVCGCLKNMATSYPGIDYGKIAGLPKECGVDVPYIISPDGEVMILSMEKVKMDLWQRWSYVCLLLCRAMPPLKKTRTLRKKSPKSSKLS
ncbi:hypothetical protein SASPL_101548 [Salvia splendens]|uniref:Bifunctional inhibitor/plant lipid transfer protein/seed storage helical domain-containing protein n=1 Tax=Salvia splendens TaxID=180675 RepID=A0A8X9ADF2_SALSN|nr:hypothetical protein SASPL_101548 [Salvia splendens]